MTEDDHVDVTPDELRALVEAGRHGPVYLSRYHRFAILDLLGLAEAQGRAREWARRWKAYARAAHREWKLVAAGAEEPLLLGEELEPGTHRFRFKGTVASRVYAQAFLDLLHEHDAPNCVEMVFTTARGRSVVVEVRRSEGKTMGTLMAEEKARAAAAEERAERLLRALTIACEWWGGCAHNHPDDCPVDDHGDLVEDECKDSALVNGIANGTSS